MLKKVKSIYITKTIFSHLNEGRKLKLVKYNKSLQKIIKKNLTNYKFFKGSYIVYKSKGIAKEYFGYDDTLLFEGKYSNGEKNGEGKEYNDNGKLIFEGRYSKGKRNGKGIEYDKDGKVIFKGEYSNGIINGKGKEYNKDGKVIFKGEYLKGKRSGKGKEYNKNGKIRFEGEYLNGERI